jgi:hypothetical protein
MIQDLIIILKLRERASKMLERASDLATTQAKIQRLKFQKRLMVAQTDLSQCDDVCL